MNKISWVQQHRRRLSASSDIVHHSPGEDGALQSVTTVFIAEENQFARCGLRHVLKDQPGFQVVGESGDSDDAVAQIFELQPKLVVMNLEMPGTDGVTIMRRVTDNLPGTKVMVVSQDVNDERVQAAFSAGATGYCMSGSAVERMLAAMQAVADGAGWIDPQVSERFLRRKLSLTALVASNSEVSHERQLSGREIEVLQHVAKGLSNQEIAQILFVSAETVKTHMKHIMEKLGVRDRTLAVVTAIRKGIML